jgi:hypothetical protein
MRETLYDGAQDTIPQGVRNSELRVFPRKTTIFFDSPRGNGARRGEFLPRSGLAAGRIVVVAAGAPGLFSL